MKPVICCDFDDTLNDLLPSWVAWLNEKYDLQVEVADILDWQLSKTFIDLTKQEIYEPLSLPEFWLTVNEKPGASHYLKKLIDEGYEVYICTSTYYAVAQAKFNNCLFRLFPYISHKQIITTYHKQLINCDILIDDALRNISDDRITLLMDMPHNRENYKGNNVCRVTSWQQIYRIIHSIAFQSK